MPDLLNIYVKLLIEYIYIYYIYIYIYIYTTKSATIFPLKETVNVSLFFNSLRD